MLPQILLKSGLSRNTFRRPGPHEKGLPALLRGAPDMNSLVVLGSTAAWIYSAVATFAPHVLPVVQGTRVEFPNYDDLYHNVFSLSKTKTFDLGRYAAGKSRAVLRPMAVNEPILASKLTGEGPDLAKQLVNVAIGLARLRQPVAFFGALFVVLALVDRDVLALVDDSGALTRMVLELLATQEQPAAITLPLLFSTFWLGKRYELFVLRKRLASREDVG